MIGLLSSFTQHSLILSFRLMIHGTPTPCGGLLGVKKMGEKFEIVGDYQVFFFIECTETLISKC